MSGKVAHAVLKEVLRTGAREFCICPAGRNKPFCSLLLANPHLKTYFWHEERSASFFAMGRSRAQGKPVVVIVTSGTAAGELLPAAMEAHYSGIPLILITADRPRRYRFSGSPQTAEQVGLFGRYSHYEADLEGDELCDLRKWDQRGVCHLNVCFEEPTLSDESHFLEEEKLHSGPIVPQPSKTQLDRFLSSRSKPLVIVSALEEKAKEPVVAFLDKLNAPVYLEAPSNIREDNRLAPLRIFNPDLGIKQCDGVLRIGGIPTHRMWRDLEDIKLPVCSISQVPFPGLSYADVVTADIAAYLKEYAPAKSFDFFAGSDWKEKEEEFKEGLEDLLLEEPDSEPSLFRSLSSMLPEGANIFLGNSMPIRNWDLAAENQAKNLTIRATRGLNGIDGQLSCFFGLCHHLKSNWGLLGDLTTLYDLSAPWILENMEAENIKIVVINNFGGRIFARKFKEAAMQNPHQVRFEGFAKLWGLSYESWHKVPEYFEDKGRCVIELLPDLDATERFWKRFAELKKGTCLYFN